MPLKKSASPKAFKENIKAEVKAGKPVKQAVAIAYSEARESKKDKKKK
jgi:Flp pilus assembly protein TadB